MSRSRVWALFVRLFGSLPCLVLATDVASPSVRTVDGAWSSLDASPAPTARREYAAIHDIQRQRYVIFGGFGFQAPDPGGLFLEVWTLSLGPNPTWAPLAIDGPSPGERHSPQWGYDPARQRLIIFGGYGHHYPGGPNEYLNDVWELSLDGTPTWTELHPTGTPPEGRLAGASVYDPLRQRFVGFGGTRGLPVDTWALDLSGEPAWTALTIDSTNSPPGSYGMTAIYDIFRDRMLTFGGSTSDEYWGVHNDLWELSLSDPLTWTPLAPLGALPSARRTLTSVHDFIRDRMIIFGGWDSQSNNTASFLDDTWALSLSPELHWTELAPSGPIPTGRDAMAAIYDPINDRMVVFGGWSGDQMLGDTQYLDWGLSAPNPTLTASSEAEPTQAQVSWGVQNVIGERVAVYRREAGTPWSSIATIENGGSGTLVYQDQAVTPGGRYGYLLAVPSARGPVVGGEIWVDVPTSASVTPTPLALALQPVRPHPVVGRIDVSFTLEGDAPARLDLIDVSGRRIVARELGGLVPGPHQVEIGDARDFPSGVYFLRLTQGGRSLARPVVLSGRR
ncbi:MAG: Kelch repeat-containing protein [Candidatus Eiseniibacteriota bacterium]